VADADPAVPAERGDVVSDQTFILTRGLPGCGKTSAALKWAAKDRDRRFVIERDAVRTLLRVGHGDHERLVTIAQHAMIGALLDGGYSVAVADTNLVDAHVRRLLDIGAEFRVPVEIWDMTNVPVDVCLSRNSGRAGAAHVPEGVIRRMHEQHIAGRPYPLPAVTL
jgi:predicted kinase